MHSTTPRQPRLPRSAGFAVLVADLLALMAAASVPSPIYHLYQERLEFPTWVLTLIFAIYAVVLLATLLTAGSLSDHIGRRPVLVAGLILQAGSTGLFWVADDVTVLLVARVLQGLSTGVALGAVSAAMVDLTPRKHPGLGTMLSSAGLGLGLALGAVVVGLAGQFTTAPDQWVFPVLTVSLILLALLSVFVPGVHPRKPGAMASLWPTIGVSPALRPVFTRALPGIAAGWAIMGLFMALGPSLIRADFHADPTIAGAYVITVLALFNAIGAVGTARFAPAIGSSVGPALMVLGMAWALFSVQLDLLVLHFVAAALAGAGVGASFTSGLRIITAATPAMHRAQTMSAVYVLSYLSLSLPALAAGVLATQVGLNAAVEFYGGAVMLLAAAASVLSGVHRGGVERPATAAETSPVAISLVTAPPVPARHA
jgi:MFS family permease